MGLCVTAIDEANALPGLQARVQLAARVIKLRRIRAMRADDTFLVSYPKSVNIWTRFLVANLLHPDQTIDFESVDRLVPNSPEAWVGLGSPRIFKNHEPFRPNFPNVIYIVRDPRDVGVSEFHWCRKPNRIADDLPISQVREKEKKRSRRS